jgi:hypothetical protein
VSRLLPQCEFNYVRRDANIVVHKLAQRALRSQKRVEVTTNVPEDIYSIVEAEVAVRGNPDLCNSLVPILI